MSELHKFLFDGVPVRGMIVRLTEAWQEVLARRASNTATGAYPKPVAFQRPPPAISPYGAPAPKGKARPHEPLSTGGVWFRVNVGRAKKADPRWLLPLICRRGGVFKKDIGKIEIMSDEDYPTKAADARLISAAPELLEALELLMAPDDGKITAAQLKENWRKAESAIAKARKETGNG